MDASDPNRFQVDPAVALIPPVVTPFQAGPAHHAQYVIELVGPRSIPAPAAAGLLGPEWFNALGQPELFCMSAADSTWRPLVPASQGSYDSVALCWNVLSDQGTLNQASGQHLLQVAERFAAHVNRRAMPMPVPNELAKVAKSLSRIRDGLDIGISIVVLPSAGVVTEQLLWQQCARLGLQFGPAGSFDWRVPDHPSPLFQVTPIGDTDCFSLRAVQAGQVHEGITIGFNVPRCPAPAAALDGALHAADVIAGAIQGAVFDQDARPLNAPGRDQMRRELNQGVQILEGVGIKPGSAAALKIFG